MLFLPRSSASQYMLKKWPIQHTGEDSGESLARLVWSGRSAQRLVPQWLLGKTKGKTPREALVCLWTWQQCRGGISLLSSAQEEPSISRGMQRLCLIADRVSPKGWFCSLFKMTYNGAGLISVSKCIFCALSPQGGGQISSILMNMCRIDFELGII